MMKDLYVRIMKRERERDWNDTDMKKIKFTL